MMRHLPYLLILSLLLAWPAATSAAPVVPDIYVNNRHLTAVVVRRGADLLVEAAPAAAALKAPCEVDARSGRVVVAGHALTSACRRPTARGTLVLVSLRELATTVGARVREQPAAGLVDVITFDPARRAQEIGAREAARGSAPASVIHPAHAVDGPYLDFIYTICEDRLRVLLGMHLTTPVQRFFETPEQIRIGAGNDAVAGYTRWTPGRVEIHIPVGVKADRATHIMAHELSHVWQHDEHVQFGTTRLVEGFCEWTASMVLQDVGFGEETRQLEANLAMDYSQGYLYIKRMADRLGPAATVEHFRHSEWGERR